MAHETSIYLIVPALGDAARISILPGCRSEQPRGVI